MKSLEVVAGVVFNTSGDQVLLSLRKPEQHQGNLWEFPGGKLEPGETLEAGLARELAEEVGICVERCVPRMRVEHRYPDKQVCLHFWDVTDFSGAPEGREGQELKWVALSELPAHDFPEANKVVVESLLGRGHGTAS